MPLPSPRSNEDQNAFITRCMTLLEDEYPEQKQRLAVCFSQWRNEALHPDFQRILSTFVKHFKDGTGLDRFLKFIKINDLDSSKNYAPSAQFQESYQWVKPLISFYKKDKNAKYYLLRAITANISMNNNDYSDWQKLNAAHPTLRCVPVNINHDHDRRLSFPRTRVDYTGAEDLAVEASLRVDNEDAWLQRALDKGDITHPSIEGFRHSDGTLGFFEIALLEKGVELPGDPLSEIIPLFLNESVRNKICRMVNGELICTEDKCVNERGEIMSENKTDKEFLAADIARAKAHFGLSDEAWDKLTDEQKQAFIDKLPSKDAEEPGDDEESIEIRLREEMIKQAKVNEMLQRKVTEGFAREEEYKKLRDQEQTLRKTVEDQLVEAKGNIQKLSGESEAKDVDYGKTIDGLKGKLETLIEGKKDEFKKIVKEHESAISSLNMRHGVEKTGLKKLHDEDIAKFTVEINGLKESFIKHDEEVKESSIKHDEEVKANHINEISVLKESFTAEKNVLKIKSAENLDKIKIKFEISKETLQDIKGNLNTCKRINLELKNETVAAKENEDKALQLMRDTQTRCEELSTSNRVQQEELSSRRSEITSTNTKYVQQLSDNDNLREVIGVLRNVARKTTVLSKQMLKATKKAGEDFILDDGTVITEEYLDEITKV